MSMAQFCSIFLYISLPCVLFWLDTSLGKCSIGAQCCVVCVKICVVAIAMEYAK